ncbi:MAG: DUF721 domain-containing protein [Nitrospirae bacterium]|nr:DUF721 domain-containing protein [Nitrospirota bacterium]
MEKASGLFIRIVSGLGLDDMMVLQRVKDSWYVLFPQPTGLHMVPTFFKNGTIHLTIESNLWLHELQTRKKDILQKLRPYGVAEIRMKSGYIESLPGGETSTGKTVCGVLCREDAAFIDKTTEALPDGPMKRAFKRTMEKALARKPSAKA